LIGFQGLASGSSESPGIVGGGAVNMALAESVEDSISAQTSASRVVRA
jgi:hypothetical protein